MLEHRISPLEAVGLRPLVPGLRQCAKAIVGDPHLPPSRFGPSSLRIFRPALGPATWLGHATRRVPILNYVNRVPFDRREGYDVRVTFARDYRGGRTTYNGHLGTDFVMPVGTVVRAPAPGRVVRVENLMHRGGLKVVLDHGHGLVTLSGHLSRSLVREGALVARGERIGLSGFSAVDGILFIPWVPPHVHFTVLLDGVPVDPFAAEGEVSLWRGGETPEPAPREPLCEVPRDAFDVQAVDASIRSCRDPAIRAELEALPELEARALRLIYWHLFAFPAFGEVPPVYREVHARSPRLDLPVGSEDFDGLAHPRASLA